MKSLVILAHPSIGDSRVNRRWRQELDRYPDEVVVHELYREYPDWDIDVGREQGLLEAHDHIVLQFPLYWYSYPPLLKKWLDDVWTHGWAYGSTGHALEGKSFGAATSVGGLKTSYLPTGSVSYSLDEVLVPLKASVRHVGARLLPHFAVFGASFQISDEEVDQSARDYVEWVRAGAAG